MTPAQARDALNLLVVSTIFASFLIPTSVVLFTFSPFSIWRSPLFILNVLAIGLELAEQGLYIYVIINTMVNRALPTSLVITILTMDFLTLICVQGILLVRLVAVYPPSINTRQQNFAIYMPVVVFKIACLVTAGYAMHDLISHLPDSLGVIAAVQFIWRTQYIKVEWFLQLFDDMFMSRLFVHKLYATAMMRRGIEASTGNSSFGSIYLWAERIRTLYYIALSNFVFPILFNIVQIVTISTDPNFFHGVTVVTVNSYVPIVGVLLATVWAQGSKRDRPHAGSGSRHRRTAAVPSFVRFTSYNVESQVPAEDDLEDEFDVEPQRVKQAGGQVMRGRTGEVTPVSTPTPTPKGKRVFFQSVGSSTVVAITQDSTDEDAEPEETRVSESSSESSGGSTTALGRGPEAGLHGTVTASYDEKRAHSAPASPISVHQRESRRSVDTAGDPISLAV